MSQGSVHEWGRVDDDGTVYVRTADGERAVGQYPDGTPEEAHGLLHQALRRARLRGRPARAAGPLGRDVPRGGRRVGQDRVARRSPTPTPSATSRRSSAGSTRSARSSPPSARPARPRRRSAPPSPRPPRRRSSPRPRRSPPAATGATAPTGCASCSTSGRRSPASTRPPTTRCGSGSRRRGRRTPGAARRTSPSRTRSARAPASSRSGWPRRPRRSPTPPTGARPPASYRDLMRQWKAAGRRPRTSTTSSGSGSAAPRTPSSAPATRPTPRSDAEFAANAEVKEKLLVEAEALLPVTDLDAAKKAFRDLADRWDAAGKVPRERMKELEGRMREVEQAIRAVEDEQWRAPTRRSPPAPTTWSPSSRPRSPRPRPSSRRPAPPATTRRSRELEENLDLPPVLPRHGQAGQRRLQLTDGAPQSRAARVARASVASVASVGERERARPDDRPRPGSEARRGDYWVTR